MSLQPGSALGSYLIVERIGRGGMATVYKAFQPSEDRYVAIKVLPAFFAEDEEVRRRFEHESLAVINLRHPNILTAYEYGEHDGVVFLVSELVDGGSLVEMAGTPRAPALVARLLGPIASALDYAHELGVLHRDVKPANILLRRDGTPVLSDFGLVRLLHGATRLTRTGMTVGTPEYMAPEQGASEAAGPAADNYALAVVAYELLTGRVPFRGETPIAILLAHMQQTPTPVSTLNPVLPATLDAVMAVGLAKEPRDRYQDATTFIEALEAAGQGKAVQSIRVPAGAAPVVAGALAGRAPTGPAPAVLPVVAGRRARRGRTILPWLAAVLLAALVTMFWVLTRDMPAPSAHSAIGGQPAATGAALTAHPTPRGHPAGGRATPTRSGARPTAIVAARVAVETATTAHAPTATAPRTATPAPTHTATALPTRTPIPPPLATPLTLPASDTGLPDLPTATPSPTATAWADKVREPESSPPPSDLRTQGAPPTATQAPPPVPTLALPATPIVGHRVTPRTHGAVPRATPRPTARPQTGLAGHVVLLRPTATPHR